MSPEHSHQYNRKKKSEIYTFSPKISLHQSLYKCVNIHVRYSNCVNIPGYCSFAFHFLIISHLCSLSTLSLSLSLARSQPRKNWSLSHIPWLVSLQGLSCRHSPPPSQLWFFLLAISVTLSHRFPSFSWYSLKLQVLGKICWKICWLLGLLERQKLGFDIWEAKKCRSWKFCWVLIFEKLGFGDFVGRLEWKKVDLKENFHGSGYLFWVMCTPNLSLTGSTYTWAHNLFVLWVLSFLLWVVPCSETQLHALVFVNSSLFPHRVAPLTTDIVTLFSPELPTLTSHSILLFIAWDEWRCYVTS